jgi:hypothetical protein
MKTAFPLLLLSLTLTLNPLYITLILLPSFPLLPPYRTLSRCYITHYSLIFIQLKSAPIFEAMNRAIQNNPSLIQKVNAVFQFNLETKEGTTVSYIVDVKNGKGGVFRDNPSNVKPDVTITISDDDYFDISTGKLNSQQVYTSLSPLSSLLSPLFPNPHMHTKQRMVLLKQSIFLGLHARKDESVRQHTLGSKTARNSTSEQIIKNYQKKPKNIRHNHSFLKNSSVEFSQFQRTNLFVQRRD